MSEGMTVRSPTSKSADMTDVEVGSSGRHVIKAKDSNIIELSSGDGKGDSSRGEGRSSAMKSLIASTMYSGCSVGMVLVNKSLASR